MGNGSIDTSARLSAAAAWEELAAAVQVRPYLSGDATTLCSWVNEMGELFLVASETEERLTPAIVRRWVATAAQSFVFELGGKLVAFATASINEASLPAGTVEMCHLIVSPQLRRKYHGSFFCRWLARLLVAGAGYDVVVGRVVPGNEGILGLMRYLRWKEVEDTHGWTEEGDFRWFVAPESRRLP